MPPSLTEIAYDRIREMVASGELPPGTRLVNRKLGSELGISPIPVREALRKLASEGLVEHIPNAGAFVRRMDRKQVIQLYALREVLEDFAVSEAVGSIDDRQVQRLERIYEEWRQLARQIRDEPDGLARGVLLDRWLACDVAFHDTLIDAVENPWLTKIVSDLALMARVVATKPPMLDLAAAARTLRTHSGLLRALRDRDVDRARRWMAAHNADGLDLVLSWFDRRPDQRGATV